MLILVRSAVAVALVALALSGASAVATPQATTSNARAAAVVDAATTKPSSALIATADIAKTSAWYRDVLGFQFISERSDVQGRSILLERSGVLLEVSDEDHIAAVSNPVSLTLLVDDVDREVATLEAKGVEVLSEPGDALGSRVRVGRIYDIDHRVVELREPLDSGETPFGHHAF
jgi:catechol 2,3-dioxygenase-like lactoylglutathione lyase family enzyme